MWRKTNTQTGEQIDMYRCIDVQNIQANRHGRQAHRYTDGSTDTQMDGQQ